MNLSDLRTAVADRTSAIERGAVGRNRLNRAINYAVRQFYKDGPAQLFRSQWRTRLEVPLDQGSLDVHPSDPLVMLYTGTLTLPTDGTLEARWLEVQRPDTGEWVQRRIMEVFILKAPPAADRFAIVMDEPWQNATDAELPFRIYTEEYPFPSDVKRVIDVRLNPEGNNSPLAPGGFLLDIESARAGLNWRNTGKPERYSAGEFWQLPAPHYTPKAAAASGEDPAFKWGFDGGGNEHGDPSLGGQAAPPYGPAGSFSYLVCHAWGRWPWQNPTRRGLLQPFYLSAPSQPTNVVATTWGGGAIKVAGLTDHHYDRGYAPDDTLPSFHRAGVEKWIFRARSTAEPGVLTNRALVTDVAADGVFYLWRVVAGYVTQVYDRGDDDPVDYRFPLPTIHGYKHLRFDRLPTVSEPVLCTGERKPPRLENDSDTPNLPEECYDLLVALTCAFIAGDRDGEPNRRSDYWMEYLNGIEDMKSATAFAGFESGVMSDGLAPAGPQGHVRFQVP